MPSAPIITPFSTTGIGSLPHQVAEDAVELSLKAVDIPFWPQLPALSFMEGMIPQYSEGMPSVRLDPQKRSIWVERSDEEIERFYEFYAEDARIAISEDYARGLYAFMSRIKGRMFECLKGQITGPLTFTLGLLDSGGKPIYYDEELREISLMVLKAKARWQMDMLKRHAQKVIIFIDEPILSALGGTSYMGVSRQETVRLLKETAEAISEMGGLSAIHCCGRAEWPMLMETGIDILNIDMYDYGESLAIYPEETTDFLVRGGMIAWGIVPTTEAIRGESLQSVQARYRERFKVLSGGVTEELIEKGLLLSPSCGAGSLSVAEATKVFQLLFDLKEALIS